MGLTEAGLGRLNRSAEAFVYCILGSQVNTRNPIYGAGGGAIETQNEFKALFENSVKVNDISKSVQNYQLAVQEAKLRLDLAVAPGVWLMPSNMIINTESVLGYNNKLMKATSDMDFGLNHSLNLETKNVGIQNSLGTTKVKLNTKTQQIERKVSEKQETDNEDIEKSSHQNNLIVLMLVGGLLSRFFISLMF